MKAIVFTKYGSPDVLKLKEVEKPTPKDNEVLIRVHATSIVYSDLAFVRGKPFLVRLMGSGLLKPRHKILGVDVAGRVEAIGRNVKKFQPDDEVFGDLSECGRGGFAEYVSVPENALALKPANCSFEEAAAVPEISPQSDSLISPNFPHGDLSRASYLESKRWASLGRCQGRDVFCDYALCKL